MTLLKNTIFTALMMMSAGVFAFNVHAPIGWLVYNVLPVQHAKKHHALSGHTSLIETATQFSSVQEMDAIKATTLAIQDEAILDPTPLNIEHYQEMTMEVGNMASSFTRATQQSLLAHPSLNFALQFPTQSYARRIYSLEHLQARKKVLKDVAANDGFVFFYQGKDMYDRGLADSLKDFFNVHHMKVIYVSVDGKKLPQFPGTVVAPGRAKALGIRYFPALVMVNPKNRRVQPIFYGFISTNQLQTRIYDVVTHYKGWL